ncbi:hypothetical protein DFH07DRAFT_1065504 [Mycena maculata]|uniref:F-box domain-containing protein n=1 Tax=Mycena maculata TaxID=230809 RepID=A0AAD7I3A8_9AGAR|nr:hypothetical protein DFH07DRAFT_1065504 [Mycena maculata]
MIFSELPPDVILSVFACCDVSSVVSTGQTCRHLHSLAVEKSVWVRLLDDLKRRSILDPTIAPNLDVLSIGDLIKVVKSLLTGPSTWTPTEAGFAPQVSKRITLHPNILTGPGILTWENETRLLRNGAHVFFNNWGKLECWHVAEDRLVWVHTAGVENASVLEFAVDEDAGVDVLRIMICVRTYPPGSMDLRENYVEIVDLDLHKGIHDVCLLVRAPNSRHDNPFSSPVICGSVAAVTLSAAEGRDSLLLIDCEAHLTVVLSRILCVIVVALVPRHIILRTTSKTGEDEIHLILSEDLFTLHGGPAEFGAHSISVVVNELPLISTQRVAPGSLSSRREPFAWNSYDQMSVHACPLHRDTYRLWVYASKRPSHGIASPLDSTLSSFDISIVAAELRPRTCVPALGPMLYRTITYSGHTQVFDAYGTRYQQILPPTLSAASGVVELDDCGDHVDVGPYSGTLAYSTHKEIVILYFR